MPKNLGNYDLDNIYCEDCYEAIKKIPDKSIDLVIVLATCKIVMICI